MRTQYAIVYQTDGDVHEVTPANGKKFDYHELQKLIGGYVESLVPGVKGCRQMYCDEDGFAKLLPPNPHTWYVVRAATYRLNGYASDWRVLGPIVAVLTREATR
jgi:hypothetical protein